MMRFFFFSLFKFSFVILFEDIRERECDIKLDVFALLCYSNLYFKNRALSLFLDAWSSLQVLKKAHIVYPCPTYKHTLQYCEVFYNMFYLIGRNYSETFLSRFIFFLCKKEESRWNSKTQCILSRRMSVCPRYNKRARLAVEEASFS